MLTKCNSCKTCCCCFWLDKYTIGLGLHPAARPFSLFVLPQDGGAAAARRFASVSPGRPARAEADRCADFFGAVTNAHLLPSNHHELGQILIGFIINWRVYDICLHTFSSFWISRLENLASHAFKDLTHFSKFRICSAHDVHRICHMHAYAAHVSAHPTNNDRWVPRSGSASAMVFNRLMLLTQRAFKVPFGSQRDEGSQVC